MITEVRAQQLCGVFGSESDGCAGGDELCEQDVQAVDGLSTGFDQVVAVLDHCAQRHDRVVELRGLQPCRGQRGDTDGDGVGIVVLASMSDRKQAHTGSQFRGHIKDVKAIVGEPGRQRCA
jgi:hypothetical protein